MADHRLGSPGWLIALLGHGKEGKTTLALHLMASLAAGKPWANHAVAQAMPAVYLGFEMGREDLCDYVRPLQRGTVFIQEPQVLLDWPAPLKLDDLKAFLEQQSGPGLLVIDSFRGAFMLGRDGEKDAGITGGLLRTMQRIARETGWTIIVIHHQRKSGQGDFLDGSGSGEWLAAPDAVWTWTRPNGNEAGTLRVTGRLPPVEDVRIKLSLAACEYVGTAVVSEDRFTELAILQHVPDRQPGLTAEEICASWGPQGPSVNTIKPKLDGMAVEPTPRIVRVGGGKKGSPHRYWKDKLSHIPLNVYGAGGMGETEEEAISLVD